MPEEPERSMVLHLVPEAARTPGSYSSRLSRVVNGIEISIPPFTFSRRPHKTFAISARRVVSCTSNGIGVRHDFRMPGTADR